MTDPIEMWHHRCRPHPTVADFNVQLGCHFEEIAELIETLSSASEEACDTLDRLHSNRWIDPLKWASRNLTIKSMVSPFPDCTVIKTAKFEIGSFDSELSPAGLNSSSRKINLPSPHFLFRQRMVK